MKCLFPHRFQPRWAVLAAFCIAVAWVISQPAEQAQANKAQSKSPQNLSVLTATWSQWIFSVPLEENPGFDTTGEFAALGQPHNDVFFLVGSFVDGAFERDITVPAGMSLFFPVANSEWDNVGPYGVVRGKDAMTVSQLRAHAKESVDISTDLYATLDGIDILPLAARIQSPVFSYSWPEASIYDAFFGPGYGSGIAQPAVSDGYWIFLPPLPAGTYELKFGATVPGVPPQADFVVNVTYNITVK